MVAGGSPLAVLFCSGDAQMLDGWRTRIRNMARDALALYLGLRDPKVPWLSKVLAFASVAYVFLPVDLIPDIIPILGLLDDAAMFPTLLYLASRIVPLDVMSRLRSEADRKIAVWGPKFLYLCIFFVVVWLSLMAIGMWFVWRDFSSYL